MLLLLLLLLLLLPLLVDDCGALNSVETICDSRALKINDTGAKDTVGALVLDDCGVAMLLCPELTKLTDEYVEEVCIDSLFRLTMFETIAIDC